MSKVSEVFELVEGTRVQIDGLPYFVKGTAFVRGFVVPNSRAAGHISGSSSATNRYSTAEVR